MKKPPGKVALRRWITMVLSEENPLGKTRAYTPVDMVNWLHHRKKLNIRNSPLLWTSGHSQEPGHQIDFVAYDILMKMEEDGEVVSNYGRRAKHENVIFFKQFKILPVLDRLAAI
jgi:hypothetical protein